MSHFIGKELHSHSLFEGALGLGEAAHLLHSEPSMCNRLNQSSAHTRSERERERESACVYVTIIPHLQTHTRSERERERETLHGNMEHQVRG